MGEKKSLKERIKEVKESLKKNAGCVIAFGILSVLFVVASGTAMFKGMQAFAVSGILTEKDLAFLPIFLNHSEKTLQILKKRCPGKYLNDLEKELNDLKTLYSKLKPQIPEISLAEGSKKLTQNLLSLGEKIVGDNKFRYDFLNLTSKYRIFQAKLLSYTEYCLAQQNK